MLSSLFVFLYTWTFTRTGSKCTRQPIKCICCQNAAVKQCGGWRISCSGGFNGGERRQIEEKVRIAIVSYVRSSWHVSRMKREVSHRKVRGRLCDNTVQHMYPLVHRVHSTFLKNRHVGPPWPKMQGPFFFSQSSPGANWRESLKATLKARRLRGLSSRTTAALLVILPLPWGRTTLQFQAHTFKTTLRAQPHRQWLQNGMARWCPLPHSRQTHPLLQLYVSNFRVGT